MKYINKVLGSNDELFWFVWQKDILVDANNTIHRQVEVYEDGAPLGIKRVTTLSNTNEILDFTGFLYERVRPYDSRYPLSGNFEWRRDRDGKFIVIDRALMALLECIDLTVYAKPRRMSAKDVCYTKAYYLLGTHSNYSEVPIYFLTNENKYINLLTYMLGYTANWNNMHYLIDKGEFGCIYMDVTVTDNAKFSRFLAKHRFLR